MVGYQGRFLIVQTYELYFAQRSIRFYTRQETGLLSLRESMFNRKLY